MVESSDETWSVGEGNGKPLQYSCLEKPMNSMKRQKDRTLKDELPRSIDAQYAIAICPLMKYAIVISLLQMRKCSPEKLSAM